MTNDPITLEIIQNSLQSAADEMFAAMKKTAMSSIIYEVLDMGTGITDARGEIACSGAGIPAFVGVLDKAVTVIVEKYGDSGSIEPGDVFVTNDPYYGGVTHLNDIVVAMPVFVGDRIIAWTANIAHNSDVGGMAPGSLTGEATEIFQEGLRLPAVKMISRGEPIQPVMEIIKVNSRMPDVLEGDVWAAIASVRIGTARLAEIAGKYGAATFEQAMTSFMDYGERVSRSALTSLPKGTYTLAEEQDDGQVFNVTITIAEDEFVVDLRDNPDQATNPVNTSRDGVMVAAQMIFKSLTDPYSPCNAGSFRPIRLLTREGSVFHAEEPAPVGFYYEIDLRAYDLMWRCLAQHMPERLAAGHFASVCGTFIGGIHPDTGRQYTIIEPQLGGWGGREGMDGNNAMFCGFHGETFNCPAEINEARNGLYVDQMTLNVEPGGEGEFTGGRGIVMDYRVRANDGFLTVGYTRSKFPAWALDGGNEGSPNYVEFIPREGERQRFAFVSGLKTQRDDVIRVVTGNGGGFGDPKKRDPDRVRRDVRNGLISAERCAGGLRRDSRASRDSRSRQREDRMKANAPLKLMYLNPVGTEAYDAVFADMARSYKLPGTEVHIACLADAGGGFTHIEYRSYETIVSRGIIQATRQAAREGFDALAIGCFYDTALHDAREISGEMVVTAPCLASCEIAASLANRFGIIVGRRKWVNQMNAVAREHGYGERLSGFYHVELGVNDFQADHAETERRLVAAGRKAVEEDYAEALILGCTLEIGFYREIEKAVGVPVIDPSIAAMKRAEYAANLKRQCGWVPSRMWSCEPPPEEEIARFGGFDEGDAFAQRLVVEAE